MPHINAAVAPVAGAACHIFDGDGFSGAVRRVRDAMGPHVIHLKQQPLCEPAIQRKLKGIEVVVAIVCLETKGTETGQWTLSCNGIDEINGIAIEKVVTLGSGVAGLYKPVVR